MAQIISIDDVVSIKPKSLQFSQVSLPSPDRVVVTSNVGPQATFTVGSKTVAISGLQQRVFTEQKRVGPETADVFGRVRSSRWGSSPFYGEWSAPIGGIDTQWPTDGTSAKVLVDTANVSRYTTLRDQDVVDYDVTVTFSISTMPSGASNSFSLVGNYSGTSSHYRFRTTHTTAGLVQLAIDKVTSESSNTVAANVQVGSGFVAGQVWNLRAQNFGGSLRCKAWPEGSVQPDWQRTYEDTTAPIGPGRLGIRAFISTGATNSPVFSLTRFEITSGRWSNPPRTQHSTWVRLLPFPFVEWNSIVEEWLKKALYDTSPDVLARSMAYITRAPAVYNPTYGAGRQVMGQANYGPNNSDGSRIEGADFNDYIRTSWDYPHLATPTSDINEIAQQFCLDCSGFVRMVFGYWHGVPMSLTDAADLNGLNLPRRSVQIGPSGPGILVASGTTSPPALDSIQIGDVVAFNADAADDVAGDNSGDVELTDDHVGIYIGQDASNNYLFISSRKTANGPTFSSLGGDSFLNGSGFWALSLRHIRRI